VKIYFINCNYDSLARQRKALMTLSVKTKLVTFENKKLLSLDDIVKNL